MLHKQEALMNRPIAVLMLATMLLGFTFAGEITSTLHFDRSRVATSEQQDGYTTVRYADAPLIDGLGMPTLPEIPLHFVIPPTATVTSVEVTNVVEEPLPGEYNVLPGQIGRRYRLNDPVPPFVPADPNIYGSSAVFPKDVARYQITGNKGGFRVAAVTAYPIRYSPTEKKLYFVSQAAIKVNYTEHAVPVTSDFPRQIYMMSTDLAGMVANPQDIRRFAPPVKTRGELSRYLPAGYYEHVIISPAVFADSFIALRDWRTLQGYPSTIVTIENICATYPGATPPRTDSQLHQGRPGDLGHDLVSSCRGLTIRRQEYRAAYVSYDGTDELPCDLYFSDLDGSWDGNHNGTYGECPGDSITGYSDVYVGFIPIDDAGQVHNFLGKLFRYEQNPGTNYVDESHLAGGRDLLAELCRLHRQRHPAELDQLQDVRPGGERTGMAGVAGAGLRLLLGHPPRFARMKSNTSPVCLIDVNQALAMTNPKLGVFITVACDVGGWDEVGTENGDCLAENSVVRAPNAWVAVMMNARFGWVDVAEHYNYEFMYRVLPPAIPMDSDFITSARDWPGPRTTGFRTGTWAATRAGTAGRPTSATYSASRQCSSGRRNRPRVTSRTRRSSPSAATSRLTSQ